MKLADLVGKSWIVQNVGRDNDYLVFINVTGIKLFESSYDGTAGYILADSIYRIKESEFLCSSIEKVNNNDSYPMNVDVYEFTEVSYQAALTFIRNKARTLFPEIF